MLSKWRNAVLETGPALPSPQLLHQFRRSLVGDFAYVDTEIGEVGGEVTARLRFAEDGENVVDVEAAGICDESFGLDVWEEQGGDVDARDIDHIAESLGWEHGDEFRGDVALPERLENSDCGREALVLWKEDSAQSGVRKNFHTGHQFCIVNVWVLGYHLLEFNVNPGFASEYHFHNACSAFVFAAE